LSTRDTNASTTTTTTKTKTLFWSLRILFYSKMSFVKNDHLKQFFCQFYIKNTALKCRLLYYYLQWFHETFVVVPPRKVCRKEIKKFIRDHRKIASTVHTHSLKFISVEYGTRRFIFYFCESRLHWARLSCNNRSKYIPFAYRSH